MNISFLNITIFDYIISNHSVQMMTWKALCDPIRVNISKCSSFNSTSVSEFKYLLNNIKIDFSENKHIDKTFESFWNELTYAINVSSLKSFKKNTTKNVVSKIKLPASLKNNELELVNENHLYYV